MSCYFYAGGKSRDFSMSMKVDFVLVWVVEIELVFERGVNILVFSLSMQIDLHFVWVAQIDLIFSVGDGT